MSKHHFLHIPLDDELWQALKQQRHNAGESTSDIVHAALREHLGLDGATTFQTSTIGAVLDGAYHGDISIGELLEHGDFGIGTFDDLDGEIVMLDGVCYRIDPECRAQQVDNKTLSPFATVTRWASDSRAELGPINTREVFESTILAMIPSANYLYGIKVTGQFRSISLRSVVKQSSNTRLVEPRKISWQVLCRHNSSINYLIFQS